MIANQGAVYPEYSETDHDIALLYMPKDIPFNGEFYTQIFKSNFIFFFFQSK